MPTADRIPTLIERMRAGDVIAMHEFFEETSPWLRRVARRWLSPPLRRIVDTDDVVSSALRRAFSSSHRVRLASEARALAWLGTIVRNRVRTLSRRTLGPGGLPLVDLPDAEPLGSESLEPSQLAAHAEELSRFRDALETLAPDERESVLLHDFRGLSYEQVASCLGRPGAEAARKLHGRAIERLRERLLGPTS